MKCCDAIIIFTDAIIIFFTVFKADEYAQTCFEIPFIQFNVDGNLYPRESNSTYNDEQLLNLTVDELNINNSLLTSISNDLR